MGQAIVTATAPACPHDLIDRGREAKSSPSERFNVISHAAGALVNPLATAMVATRALEAGCPGKALGYAVFGACLTASYVASALYHAARGPRRRRLRRYDRAAIFLAIAGFHTANAVAGMPATVLFPTVLAVWCCAVAAMRRELGALSTTQRNSILPYVALGWGGLVIMHQLAGAMEPQGLPWMAAGGGAASCGAVLFRCDAVPRHHEIWHVLVLLGNACVLAGWAVGLG
jgi:hemolysin III